VCNNILILLIMCNNNININVCNNINIIIINVCVMWIILMCNNM